MKKCRKKTVALPNAKIAKTSLEQSLGRLPSLAGKEMLGSLVDQHVSSFAMSFQNFDPNFVFNKQILVGKLHKLSNYCREQLALLAQLQRQVQRIENSIETMRRQCVLKH